MYVGIPLDGTLIVQVYSYILVRGKSAARLWMVLRALDDGTGHVIVSKRELIQLLGTTDSSLRRWVKQGEGVWWRVQESVLGTLDLYLIGIAQVCEYLGLEDPGGCADVYPEELKKSGLRSVAFTISAQHRQAQAFHAAKAKKKGRLKQLILNPEGAASNNVLGAHGFFVVQGDFICPGASLDGIAEKTGFSTRTTQRWLSNTFRLERDCAPIKKKRVATKITDPELRFQILGQPNDTVWITENAVGKPKVVRFFQEDGDLFLLGTNIYERAYVLKPRHSLRRRVRAYLATSLRRGARLSPESP